MAPTGLTVRSESINAPSHQDTPSFTNSLLQARPELFGIIRTIARYSFFSIARLFLTYNISLATQYCDGLRGAMAVYDLADPHRSMYGQCYVFRLYCIDVGIFCQV